MRFNRWSGCALAALALCAATAAAAQAPPRDRSPAVVAAWIKANVQPGPFEWLETHDKGVSYYALDDLPPTDARVRAWMRDELFEEGKGPFGTYRSRSMLTEFDCEARRWRFVAIDWYPQLNLKGRRASQDVADARWTYERASGPLSEQVLGEACKAKLGSLAPPKPSPFR
jgi:hypothetical protein